MASLTDHSSFLTYMYMIHRNLAMTRPPDTYVKLCLVSSSGQEMSRSKTSIRRGQPNPLFKETFMFQVILYFSCCKLVSLEEGINSSVVIYGGYSGIIQEHIIYTMHIRVLNYCLLLFSQLQQYDTAVTHYSDDYLCVCSICLIYLS
jgi:hypothetical protein